MVQVIKATYQDGVLKPREKLSLDDEQEVIVLVLSWPDRRSESKSDSERVSILKDQAAKWLSDQPADAVRLPMDLDSDQAQAERQEIEALVEEIRTHASQISSSEIAADISQALIDAQLLSADEQVRLESELDVLLRE